MSTGVQTLTVSDQLSNQKSVRAGGARGEAGSSAAGEDIGTDRRVLRAWVRQKGINHLTSIRVMKRRLAA